MRNKLPKGLEGSPNTRWTRFIIMTKVLDKENEAMVGEIEVGTHLDKA